MTLVSRLLVGLVFVLLGAWAGTRYGRYLKGLKLPFAEYRLWIFHAVKPFFLVGIGLYLLSLVMAGRNLGMALSMRWPAVVPQTILVLLKTVIAGWFGFGWVFKAHDEKFPRFVTWNILFLVFFWILEIGILLPAAWFLPDHSRYRDGIMMQSSNVTCVPTTLSNVSRLYGRNFSEKEATEICGTCLIGSFMSDLVRSARGIGFEKASFTNDPVESLLAEDRPCLLTIDNSGAGVLHAVGLVGAASDVVFIADPLMGLRRLQREEFTRNWKGLAVRLERPTFSPNAEVRLSGFDPGFFQAGKP